MRTITEQEILEARTKRGGWTREILARWGVPWPPPNGWKDALINESYVALQAALTADPRHRRSTAARRCVPRSVLSA
jgi:hypothetical protein